MSDELKQCPVSDCTGEMKRYGDFHHVIECPNCYFRCHTANYPQFASTPLTPEQQKVIDAMDGATSVEGCCCEWETVESDPGMQRKTVLFRRSVVVWEVGDGYISERQGIPFIITNIETEKDCCYTYMNLDNFKEFEEDYHPPVSRTKKTKKELLQVAAHRAPERKHATD